MNRLDAELQPNHAHSPDLDHPAVACRFADLALRLLMIAKSWRISLSCNRNWRIESRVSKQLLMQACRLFAAYTICLPIASATDIQTARSMCSAIDSEFVQITVGTLNAGTIRYEAFRISAEGLLQRAVWDSERVLFKIAEPVSIGSSAYKTATQIVTSNRTPWAWLPDFNTSPTKRRGIFLDLAQLSSQSVQFTTLNQIPAEIETKLAAWRRITPGQEPPPGRYLWTAPYANQIGDVDINLKNGNCQNGFAKTLHNAIQSGRLITPVSEYLDAFMSGSNKYRHQFGARIPSGYVRFGIVNSNPSR